MRAASWLVPLALAAALGACKRQTDTTPAAQVALAQPAAPAAGLWIQRVSDRDGVAVTRYCLDDAGARTLAAFAGRLNQACRRRDMAQAADGSWRFLTDCDAGVWGKVSADGVAKGDFARHYTVEALTQRTGATAASANGPRRIFADISRQNACPKDMKPGDVVWPDGRRSKLGGLDAPA